MDENDELAQTNQWRERWDRAWGLIICGWGYGLFGVAFIWASMTEGGPRSFDWGLVGVVMCAFGTLAIRWGRQIKKRLLRDIDAARSAEPTE